jgi:HTH-type transcriptional regulator / antitoxin HipB
MRVRTKRELGALLRDAREQQGLTQQELADRINVSRRWINGLENGTTNPTFELLVRCLDALSLQLSIESVTDLMHRPPSSLDRIISHSRRTVEG